MLAPAYKHLSVYRKAMQLAMEIFESSKTFPLEERYGLMEQIRTSSRLVCSYLSEAWQNRTCAELFICKLREVESEVGRTRTWCEFACRCGYCNLDYALNTQRECSHLLSQITLMIDHAEDWLIHKVDKEV